MIDFALAVAWHNEEQIGKFMEAWKIPEPMPSWLFLQQDRHREGGTTTKNKAIRRAVASNARVVVVLDDDCFPEGTSTLEGFCELHCQALNAQEIEMFHQVTYPPSRGTPYTSKMASVPVAASLGFWTEIGDYCAVRQLALNSAPMKFDRRPVFGKYFPFCGMNYAFRVQWEPWFYLVEDVGRFDDIWMGWMWQRKAFEMGYCFNLGGPVVRHIRQSNVWENLKDESVRLEKNETLWRKIAAHHTSEYESLMHLVKYH